MAQARELNPDVIMMGLQMPGMDGSTATRQLRGGKILMLTTFGTDDHAAQALASAARARAERTHQAGKVAEPGVTRPLS